MQLHMGVEKCNYTWGWRNAITHGSGEMQLEMRNIGHGIHTREWKNGITNW